MEIYLKDKEKFTAENDITHEYFRSVLEQDRAVMDRSDIHSIVVNWLNIVII